jgi:hypothetical protein
MTQNEWSIGSLNKKLLDRSYCLPLRLLRDDILAFTACQESFFRARVGKGQMAGGAAADVWT